jgi:predicted O-linked N-acetylglucosamine transferase (SPINDLY family)
MLGWLKRRSTGSPPIAATAASPRSATELRSEGNAWLGKGDLAKAEACYRQAVTADAADVQALVNLAYVLNEQQRPAEARLHALQATLLEADSVDALYVLANAQVQELDWPAATASLKRVLQLKPDFEPAYGVLCRALAEQDLLDQARAIIQQGLRLNSRSGEFHFYLGNLEMTAGAWDAAVGSYGQALALAPAFSDAHQNLGRALLASGCQREAIDSLQRGVTAAPSSAQAHHDLGTALQQLGQLEAAAKSYRSALARAPRQADIHDKLGLVLTALGDKAAAARCHRQAIALQPGNAGFHNNLGMALVGEDSMASYREALRLDPRLSVAHCNTGVALYEQGDIAGAASSFRAAMALEPEGIDARSKLLFVSSFNESCTPAQYRAEAEAYGELASRLATPFNDWPFANARDGGMPLRVGLVSGDLRSHPVGHFVEAVMSHLPRHRIELVAYTTDPRQDDLTDRIRPYFALWRSLVGLSDELAARMVRNDGVQVLVDLAGHTANNRLPVFAWRPAPVQVSWLGFFASTGLRAIDYVLADALCLPPQDEGQFVEKVWRLPEIRYCFTPPSHAPEVTALPALTAGHLTFGSFQNLAKVSETTMDQWAAVLRALPTARFRVQSPQLGHAFERDRLLARFAARGVSADRIDLHGAATREAYLAAHGEVDVLLDTFPFSGGTTTCEAVWMGVPTVVVEGRTMLTRQGASLMRTVGLDDWVARDARSFVDTVLARVTDLQRLAALRLALRERAQASPLYDAPRFAASLAQALHSLASCDAGNAGFKCAGSVGERVNCARQRDKSGTGTTS